MSLLDDDTNLPVGVFSAAYCILDGTEIDEYDRSEIRKTLDWFKSNLPVPDRFRRSRKPNRQEKGICWFKSEATECMANIRYLVHLVDEQNIIVREVVTDLPAT